MSTCVCSLAMHLFRRARGPLGQNKNSPVDPVIIRPLVAADATQVIQPTLSRLAPATITASLGELSRAAPRELSR